MIASSSPFPTKPLLANLTSLLAGFAAWQLWQTAERMGIAWQNSKTWLALLGGLCLLALASLAIQFLSLPAWRFSPPGWVSLPLWGTSLLAYPLILLLPTYTKFLRDQQAARMLLFWLLGLGGGFFLHRLFRLAYPVALGINLLGQAALYLALGQLLGITNYPFALGWSETSRFYYPSLFLSQSVYGQQLPLPILHPSLHLLLTPPYLVGAPLWAHRAWQIFLRLLLVGGIAPALLRRLKIDSAPWRVAAGLWLFLTLFNLPLYLHLAPPILFVLLGCSAKDDRRTWVFVILASLWAGLSRINWYPVPGMLAAALYILHSPYQRRGWRYLLLPVAWVFSGSLAALLAMRSYIAVSGIASPTDFYTSLSSALLWYRLFPNATYSLGLLPGISLYSLPLWLVIAAVLLQRQMHPLRAGALLLGLAILFGGGLIVSVKIGGGGDLHNMDAYALALILVAVHLFFGRYAPEPETPSAPSGVLRRWFFLTPLVLLPVWLAARGNLSLPPYASAQSAQTLQSLGQELNAIHQKGGEILFITQRHLLAMKMISPLPLYPAYEREELMEMAMAGNQIYLDTFKADLRTQRFAAIVVDPLAFNLLGSDYEMGEENNAWARFVIKPILCNYAPAFTYPADRIVIYQPQEEPTCPNP